MDKLKNKKVGIITFHSAHNYGASLQTYATQTFLQKINYQAEIINYRNKKIDKNFRVFNISMKNVKEFLHTVIRDIVFFPINLKKYKTFEKFIKNNYVLSKKYKTEKELKENPPDDDIYITGSDQIWSYYLLGELEDSYTLNFGNKDKKRISYAASVGDSNTVLEHKEEFKRKLEYIQYLSVREQETKEKLDTFINKNVEVVLDPTLILKKEEWDKKCRTNSIKEKYVLVYSVGMHYENAYVANYLSKKTGYKIIHFERVNHFENTLKSVYGCDPFDFITLIKNAEYIITTSFHATVFSVLFGKKFWVVKPPKAGVRISNLLEKVGLSERIVENLEEFKKKNYEEEIDYVEVNEKLEEERKKSIQWFENALQGE